MIRGVGSLAEQRARQQRGGLMTRARLGGEAMTAPARKGFRARFEREALEHAAQAGRTLSQRQLDEAVTSLMRAHMAMMTEKRLAKRNANPPSKPSDRAGKTQTVDQAIDQSDFVNTLAFMPDAQRKALTDSARDRVAIQRIVQPIVLCVGCWVELCPESPFPREASSTLCETHLATYTRSHPSAIIKPTAEDVRGMQQQQKIQESSQRTSQKTTRREAQREAQRIKRSVPALQCDHARKLDQQSLQ